MEQLIHAIIFDVVVKAVIAYAVTAVPFLNAPVIHQLFVWSVEKIASVLEKVMIQMGFTLYVDLKTEVERKAYSAAVLALKTALHPPDGSTPSAEQIAKARADFKSAFGDLIGMRINKIERLRVVRGHGRSRSDVLHTLLRQDSRYPSRGLGAAKVRANLHE